ncbi:MAG: AMP-binding protein [Chloroflexi bacterium]|nr:AMP-binding protein [Chloroflexota bacterium]
MTLDARLRDLIAHAYEKAPTIRRVMEERGLTPADVQSAADLPKLPVMPKDRLVELQQQFPPFGGLLTCDPADLPRIYISPGPIYDPQPPSDDPAALLAPFEIAGFGRGDRVFNTFMYHLTPAGLLLDEALRALGATVIPTGPGNTELQIMMMTSLQVTGYVGTPSFLAILIDKATEMGLPKEAFTIKKAIFSAEPYTPSQRARFEGDYGMTTVSAYGTADLGLFGYTAPGVTGFCVTRAVYVEVVDPETGQPVEPGTAGEIVVTTFNRNYPLIRFGTGDLGALAPEPDAGCGGGQQLLGLFGRSGDAIKVRGMFLHPNQLLAVKGRIPQIKNLRAVITRPDNKDVVTVQVELLPEYAGIDVDEPVKAVLNGVARLRVDAVEVVEAGVIDPAQRAIVDARKWD